VEGTSNEFQGNRNDAELRQVYPISDIVSMETVVNLLIQKGILRPEELFEEERRRRQFLAKMDENPPVEIESDNGTATGKKGNWLKRTMSNRRWTRRLGTFLFGWKWKKVKIEKKKESRLINIQNEQ